MTASPVKIIDNFMVKLGESLEKLKIDNENLGKDIQAQKLDTKWKHSDPKYA